MRKRFFVEVLREICKGEGFVLEDYSLEWMLKITDPKSKKFTFTFGYAFDLNTGVSSFILNDKVATYNALNSLGVAAVPHYLLTKTEFRSILKLTSTVEEDVDSYLNLTGLPAVVKQVDGYQGQNVFLCKDKHEVLATVYKLNDGYSLAISKYFESEYEYRFFILDGEILLAYKKVKVGGWKHNLTLGAKPEIIDHKSGKFESLVDLAKNAFSKLNLRCASVDVLETVEGYKVLEINNGIGMEKFASLSNDNYLLAKEAHRKMLLRSMVLNS